MDRVAVFVDAGYLFAQGSVALSGQRQPRGSMIIDHEKAIESLSAFAAQVSGLPILRIYWYDGTSSGPTPQHSTLAHLQHTKVKLGFVNSAGLQKGVDSLIVTDMINLARNRAMADVLLLSGDEDLRVGVQQAQEFGVKVHLLGIRPCRGNQSTFLLQEADSTHEWGLEDLSPFLRCSPSSSRIAHPEPASPKPTSLDAGKPDKSDVLHEIGSMVATRIPENELRALVETIQQSGQTPREIDGLLLAKARDAIGMGLTSPQKKIVRVAFLNACLELIAGLPPSSTG